jgi:biopolymer transport protein ExbD
MKVRFGKRNTTKKSLNVSLNLTALIDAFSILVIFMIFTMASGEYEPNDGIKLAEVAKSAQIDKSQVITVTPTEYMFKKQKMTFAQLRSLVLSQKSEFATHKAVVEADQATPYSQIQPVMALMSELEIETIQLAVASEETL